MTEARLRKKFDLAYFLAKENLPFKKFVPMAELEERHDVDLSVSYRNEKDAAEFISYIPKTYCKELERAMASVNFFSILADGSTDHANVENEVFLAFYFDHRSCDGRVRVRNKLLAIQQPKSTTGKGLYHCRKQGLNYVQLDDWKKKLISFGCDGASANIAANGLKGHLEKDVPWILMFWCLYHRLELALKDALKANPTFLAVDEMLLRLYFLYEKSPKKCGELKDIVEAMASFVDEYEFPSSGVNKPLRACGTRFIATKYQPCTTWLKDMGHTWHTSLPWLLISKSRR